MTHQKTGKVCPICKGEKKKKKQQKQKQSPNVGISKNFKLVIINMLKNRGNHV